MSPLYNGVSAYQSVGCRGNQQKSYFSKEKLNQLHADACLNYYSERNFDYSRSISNYSESNEQRSRLFIFQTMRDAVSRTATRRFSMSEKHSYSTTPNRSPEPSGPSPPIFSRNFFAERVGNWNTIRIFSFKEDWLHIGLRHHTQHL